MRVNAHTDVATSMVHRGREPSGHAMHVTQHERMLMAQANSASALPHRLAVHLAASRQHFVTAWCARVTSAMRLRNIARGACTDATSATITTDLGEDEHGWSSRRPYRQRDTLAILMRVPTRTAGTSLFSKTGASRGATEQRARATNITNLGEDDP